MLEVERGTRGRSRGGARWRLGAGAAESFELLANSHNLSCFLQLSSELCQKARDETEGESAAKGKVPGVIPITGAKNYVI